MNQNLIEIMFSFELEQTWEKKLLKKSYNILILSLAITDALTSICLVTNPAYIYGDLFSYPKSPALGEIFCRFIWSRFTAWLWPRELRENWLLKDVYQNQNF